MCTLRHNSLFQDEDTRMLLPMMHMYAHKMTTCKVRYCQDCRTHQTPVSHVNQPLMSRRLLPVYRLIPSAQIPLPIRLATVCHWQGNTCFGMYTIVLKSFQTFYNPRRTVGCGLADGEATERMWSNLRRYSAITKEMGTSSRRQLLSEVCCHMTEHTLRTIGNKSF